MASILALYNLHEAVIICWQKAFGQQNIAAVLA